MRPASLEKGAEETTSALSMRRRTYTIALTMDIDNDDHAKVDGETARLVSSWLQDQLQCASVGGIASACGISRSAAALTLEHLLPQKSSKEGQHPTYRVTSVSTTSETLKWNNKKSASSSDAEISPREESIPCTVFRLSTKDVAAASDDDNMDSTKGVVYALAVVQKDSGADESTTTTESLLTAHERDMARLRDQLVSNSLDDTVNAVNLSSSSPSSSPFTMIAPSDAIARRLESAPATRLRWWEEANASTKPAVANSNSRIKKAVPTTAASFFGKAKKAASSSSAATSKAAAASKKSQTTTTSTKSKSSSGTGSAMSEDEKENSRGGASTSATSTAAAVATADSSATTKNQTSKTKSGVPMPPSKRQSLKKVGDVDDFVGDMEEDDDDNNDLMQVDKDEEEVDEDDDSMDEKAMPSKKSRSAKFTKKASRAALAILESDDEEDDNDSVQEVKAAKKPRAKATRTKKPDPGAGALDAFTTRKEAPAPAPKNDNGNGNGTNSNRRRKKTWVDKTTVDANGYLHTESQEVWVDVSSDEDEPSNQSSAKTTTANAAKAAAAKTNGNAAAKKKPSTKAAVGGKKKPAMKQGNLMGFFQKK